MNISVAIIALILIVISEPVTQHPAARIDYRGLVLIAAGVALSVARTLYHARPFGWLDPILRPGQ